MDGLREPRWLNQLFDDASILPPVGASVATSVAGFRDHHRSGHANLVGTLVIPDVKVADLLDVLEDATEDDEPLPVCLRVTGGAGAVAPALRWASRSPVVELRRIEVGLRDPDDLAGNARRFVAALDSSEEDLSSAEIHVEVPLPRADPGHGWLAALDEIASAGFLTSFRIDPGSMLGDPRALAASIDAALDREIAFRVLGDVDRLTSTSSAHGGHDQDRSPGFGNVLVATHACLAGASPSQVGGVLLEPSWERLLESSGLAADDDALVRARRWMRSVSSPDVLESRDDLALAGVLRDC